MAAEGVLVKGVIQVLKLVIPVVAKTVGFTWSLKSDLKKLQETLKVIHAKIADAEEKKDKNNELRLWLKRLKNAAYDADDVIDDFSYESMRLSERQSFRCKARDFFSSSNPLAYCIKLAKNIKEINKRFDEIAKDMERFHLQTTFNNIIIDHGESTDQWSRQTASVIIDSEIVGRKDDTNKIVDILTKESTSSSSSSSSDAYYHSSEKLSVISVVGMGGVGKTTLAQLVYNDELVIKHFDQRIWICVSTDFDVENILIKIMESITHTKFHNLSNFDVLVNKVRETLQRKRFLLVLDDLWNENFEQWESLKSLLLAGAQGSKILITTRKMQVADVVKGGTPPCDLEGLQEDECWSIMEKRAFSPGGAVKTHKMINIGKEIAKKCSGLPLAEKFLGSLMHSKNKESDWLSIKETDLWNAQQSQSAIGPVLKLSYDNLSPHLKQCISFCTIFPKGWEIKRETLIHLWMAEGFLGTSSNLGNEQSMEDVGEEYFDSLVRSSFLDAVKKDDLDDIITCKMLDLVHDLVHDLGRDAIGNRECAVPKISELENISDIQRSSLISDTDLTGKSSIALSEMKKLRTVIVLEPINAFPYNFSSNKKLRVLHFGRAADDHSEIWYPAANKLKHLRYFYLSNLNLTSMMHIDDYISRLYNLQTLVLTECYGIQILLDNMGSLQNLRHLNISSTDIKELPNSVTSLCNLQSLNLNNCKNLVAFPKSVTGLQYLKHLYLAKTSIEELPGFIISLCSLQTLDVSYCVKLQSLPEYVAGLANLRIFDFRGCPLEALPIDFAALTQLRSLDLNGTAIKVLPEACGNLQNPEYVNLFECEGVVQVKNWTKLRKFYFQRNMATPTGIGKLDTLQELSYTVREQVANEQAEGNDGIEEFANLNFLQGLVIRDLQNLKDPKDAERANLKGKQNLRKLELFWGEIEEKLGMTWDQNSCNHHLPVFEALQPPTCLTLLIIENFMGWDLPKWMCDPSGLSNLVQLELLNCKGIKQLPESIGKLPRLRFLNLPGLSLKSLDMGGFPSLIELILTDMFLLEELSCLTYPSCLQKLWISGCKSLIEIAKFPSLLYMQLGKVNQKLVWSVGRSQTSLTQLFLQNIEGLVYFPISILQNNCNLQILQIEGCNQLEGFGVTGDENGGNNDLLGPKLYNVALRHLQIIDCPVLKFLPDLQGCPSQRKLELKKIHYKLVWSVGRNQTSLTQLFLENIDGLVYFPITILQSSCNLRILWIKGCNQLHGFRVNEDREDENKVTQISPKFHIGSLQELYLMDCPVLKFLPDLRGWTSLVGLLIFNCPKVKESLTYDLKSLSFLIALCVDFIQRDEEKGDPSNTDELINLMEK